MFRNDTLNNQCELLQRRVLIRPPWRNELKLSSTICGTIIYPFSLSYGAMSSLPREASFCVQMPTFRHPLIVQFQKQVLYQCAITADNGFDNHIYSLEGSNKVIVKECIETDSNDFFNIHLSVSKPYGVMYWLPYETFKVLWQHFDLPLLCTSRRCCVNAPLPLIMDSIITFIKIKGSSEATVKVYIETNFNDLLNNHLFSLSCDVML